MPVHTNTLAPRNPQRHVWQFVFGGGGGGGGGKMMLGALFLVGGFVMQALLRSPIAQVSRLPARAHAHHS